MSLQSFMFALAVGGALIAFWIAMRFPNAAPKTLAGAFGHLFAAMIAMPATSALVPTAIARLGAVVTTMTIVLPMVVYVFLSGAWLIVWAQRWLARAGR